MADRNEDNFSVRFRNASTDLERIKLAIKENRYTIWARSDKPNCSEEYLSPILNLPARHSVKRSPRISVGEGFDYVIELKYLFQMRGKNIPIYLKGYFSKEGHLVIGFEVQSLRRND